MLRHTECPGPTLAHRKPVAPCTLVDTAGSTPLKPGAKMLGWPDGSIVGNRSTKIAGLTNWSNMDIPIRAREVNYWR